MGWRTKQIRLLNTLALTSFNSCRVNNPIQNEAEISSERSSNKLADRSQKLKRNEKAEINFKLENKQVRVE